MEDSLLQDLTSRLATAGRPTARDSDAGPRDEVGPGFRLVDGELLYSEKWLDDETLPPGQLERDATSEDEDDAPDA